MASLRGSASGSQAYAGYAADGYARSRGVGACVVTLTVGNLSVLNAIAGAYSENLPVICIVGGSEGLPPNFKKLLLVQFKKLVAKGKLTKKCSNTMSSVIKRYDNMVLFARQGAASQGYFMRQVTVQQFPGLSNGGTSHLDTPLECSGKVSAACGNNASAALTGQDPLFSKPVEFRHGTAGALEIQQQQQQNMQSIARPPLFAKPAGGSNNLKDTIAVEGHLTGQRMNNFHGLEWSPRMDVAESDSAYVVTIELPGVSDSTIRVEVNDKSLIVTGTRSTEWWRDGNGKSISTPVYHRQELSQGPYRVVWQLPDNSNKDEVSAEFVDGFLQITILKRDQ